MIFGMRLCRWILMIPVNLQRYVSRTSLTWWWNVDVNKITHSNIDVTSCTWHWYIATEFILPEMWPLVNSPYLNLVDYSVWGILEDRVYHSRIHDVKELKERLLTEWKLLDHSSSRQWLRSSVVVWALMFVWMLDILNINFEPMTFWCVLFVLLGRPT